MIFMIMLQISFEFILFLKDVIDTSENSRANDSQRMGALRLTSHR